MLIKIEPTRYRSILFIFAYTITTTINVTVLAPVIFIYFLRAPLPNARMI